MREANRCWPTAGHQRLLKAILACDGELEEAWAHWKQNSDITKLDYSEQRLLPLLYERLRRRSISDPQMEILRGVYRFTWSKNLIQFHAIQKLLAGLHQSGIEPMLLKGAALTGAFYGDLGLRLMDDIDILVPPNQVDDAIAMMHRLMYVHKDSFRCRLLNRTEFRSVTHSQPFVSPEGREVDLHWAIARECCRMEDHEGFWERSLPLNFQGMITRTLDPTDQLFHVCLHGAKWADPAPIRWIADAALILEKSTIDWARLIDLIRTVRVVRFMKDSFACLSDCFQLPIPIDFLSELHSLQPAPFELPEYLTLTSDTTRTRQALKRHWANHTRLTHSQNLLRRLLSFPRFLQYHWALPSLWQLPLHMCKLFRLRNSSIR